jgi:hypothetical protein
VLFKEIIKKPERDAGRESSDQKLKMFKCYYDFPHSGKSLMNYYAIDKSAYRIDVEIVVILLFIEIF